jgi:hypothetical protein
MGKMAESESKSTTSTNFGGGGDLASQLTEFLSGKGTQESDLYKQLSSIFSNTMGAQGGSFQLPDYITNTLMELSGQGAGLNMPLEDTAFYKSVIPNAQRQITENVIPGIKEKFGSSGALRSSAYGEAAGKGASDTMFDAIMKTAMEAYQQEEAARSRQLGAATQGIGAYLAPFSAMSGAVGAGKEMQGMEYPLLSYIIQLLSLYKGQETDTTEQESPLGIISSLLSGGGKAAGGAAALIACHIVNELYGLPTPKGRYLFCLVNYVWPTTFVGGILNKLYRQFSKPVSVFISRPNLVSKLTRLVLRLFFDYQYNSYNSEEIYVC